MMLEPSMPSSQLLLKFRIKSSSQQVVRLLVDTYARLGVGQAYCQKRTDTPKGNDLGPVKIQQAHQSRTWSLRLFQIVSRLLEHAVPNAWCALQSVPPQASA